MMKKLFAGTLVLLSIIAALGLWEMIEASIAYRERPVLVEMAKPIESMSKNPAYTITGGRA